MNGSKTRDTNKTISRAVGRKGKGRGEEESWWERRNDKGGKEVKELRRYSRSGRSQRR